jgi:hypothetical protein
MVLVVGGTNSAVRKIVAPLADKIYVVSNQTSGGYAITIGASTGSYVTIPNGVTTVVYCDSVNFYAGLTGTAGNFVVNGNLTATGGEALLGNLSVGGTATLTGAATAPTVASSDNSTNIATTAFVQAKVGTLGTMASQNSNSVSITGGAVSGVSLSGTTITASSSFSGPGTGLTGTASGLSIGGNAATATTATNISGGGAGGIPYQTGSGTTAIMAVGTAGQVLLSGGTSSPTWGAPKPRVLASTANSATPTLNTDNYDMMVITGQSAAITSFTTNLSGTPVNGQRLWISVTGTTAIAITWGTSFEASTAALPTTTTTTNRLDIGFVWNVATSKWRCIAVA